MLPRHRVAQVRRVQPLAKVRQRRHPRRVVPQRRLALSLPLRPGLNHLVAEPVVGCGAEVHVHVRPTIPVYSTYVVVGAVKARGVQAPHPLKRRSSPTHVKLTRAHLHSPPVPRRCVQQQRVVRVAYGVHARGVLQHRLGRYTRVHHVLRHRGGLMEEEAALLQRRWLVRRGGPGQHDVHLPGWITRGVPAVLGDGVVQAGDDPVGEPASVGHATGDHHQRVVERVGWHRGGLELTRFVIGRCRDGRRCPGTVGRGGSRGERWRDGDAMAVLAAGGARRGCVSRALDGAGDDGLGFGHRQRTCRPAHRHPSRLHEPRGG